MAFASLRVDEGVDSTYKHTFYKQFVSKKYKPMNKSEFTQALAWAP